MTFAIRYAGRDFPLREGRFTIGRSEDCQLCLDDPVASRHPATISLEDLNSRNGVYLNESRVEGQLTLKHGDKIRVGVQEMLLVRKSPRAGSDTLIQRETTPRVNAFGVLGGLAEKAIGMGRGDEAERIIGRQLDALVDKAEEGDPVDAADMERAIFYCLRIAELTKKSRWVSSLFRLHAAKKKLIDAETVNLLYSLGPKLDISARPALRAYLLVLAPRSDSYSPGDRFVMKRLEGLEQVLR
jgi:pSer/pThr/pTyr-binding forkhead associated (FHA) protein